MSFDLLLFSKEKAKAHGGTRLDIVDMAGTTPQKNTKTQTQGTLHVGRSRGKMAPMETFEQKEQRRKKALKGALGALQNLESLGAHAVVFGSVVRPGAFKKGSDIDICIIWVERFYVQQKTGQKTVLLAFLLILAI